MAALDWPKLGQSDYSGAGTRMPMKIAKESSTLGVQQSTPPGGIKEPTGAAGQSSGEVTDKMVAPKAQESLKAENTGAALKAPRRHSGVHAGAESLANVEEDGQPDLKKRLQSYRKQAAMSLSDKELHALTRELLEEISAHLKRKGVVSNIVQKDNKAPYLHLQPDGEASGPLGRFASGLDRNLHGVELIYDPNELREKKFTAMYSPRHSQILLSEKAILNGRPGDAEIHEARHAFHDKKSTGSELFLGKIIPSGKVKTSGFLGPYTFLLSADEMSAYAITTALTASGLGKIKQKLKTTNAIDEQDLKALRMMAYRFEGWAKANRPLLETISGECEHWHKNLGIPKRKGIRLEQIGNRMTQLTWRSKVFWKGDLRAEFRVEQQGKGGIVSLQEPSHGSLIAFQLRDVDFKALVAEADPANYFEKLDGPIKDNLGRLHRIAETQLEIYQTLSDRSDPIKDLTTADVEQVSEIVDVLHEQIRALKATVTSS